MYPSFPADNEQKPRCRIRDCSLEPFYKLKLAPLLFSSALDRLIRFACHHPLLKYSNSLCTLCKLVSQLEMHRISKYRRCFITLGLMATMFLLLANELSYNTYQLTGLNIPKLQSMGFKTKVETNSVEF